MSSQFRFGDWLLDESAIAISEQHSGVGIENFAGEKLQAILAIPLYALGWFVPGFGLVHSVWLFNILVTIALTLVFFRLCRQLGYGLGVSVLATLLLGSATIFLPYSKTFFREPLVTLWLLLVALAILRAQETWGWKRLAWLLAGSLAFFAATETKQSSLLAIPGLLCLFLPQLRDRYQKPQSGFFLLRFYDLTLLLIGVSALASCFIDLDNWISATVKLLRDIGVSSLSPDTTFYMEAMRSQLLSPGGSFWGSSPILLLALPGACWLWWRRERRWVLSTTLLLLVYAFGHALRGEHWFGGLSWPPRFLLPTIPFVMLLTLPSLRWIIERRPRLAIIGTSTLLLYSFWWQITAVALPWEKLVPLFPANAEQLLEWPGSLYQPDHLRPILINRAIGPEWDFAWWRTGQHLLSSLYIACISVGIYFLYRITFGKRHLLRWQLVTLSVLTLILYPLSLFAFQNDPFYSAGRERLQEVPTLLEKSIERGDYVLVTQEYRDFILNHGVSNNARFIVLSHQPGETYNPEIPPTNTDATTHLAMDRYTVHRLTYMFDELDGFYFLSDSSMFLPWRPQVLERYFAETAYAIREINTSLPSPDIRLLEYTIADTPPLFTDADQHTEVQFGDWLRLKGFQLPSGKQFLPGETIPLALEWEALTAIPQDLTIVWKLAQNGRVQLSAMDWQPKAGLARTSTWVRGIPHWDLRALRLPSNFPSGEYELWLSAYYFLDNEPQNLLITQQNQQEGHIAVLPVTITVNSVEQ